MTIGGFAMEKNFKRGVIWSKGVRVLFIRQTAVSTQLFQYLSGRYAWKHKSSSNIKNMLVLAFYLSILLWSFNASGLVNNTFVMEESGHVKLWSIITRQSFDSSIELTFHHIGERLKTNLSIRFAFK